ncbi:MAG TPA: TonB-dependent receptor plug domain-containing protein, partial [Anaeromyxobacteraceae bacterium]|nr:TonB-dependent receptor plug domain-containing protein [Anaeromyxobacteraceae bacterium]
MDFRSWCLILVCSLATSEAALGQSPPDAGSTPQQFEEELLVTGSRVPRKDLTAPGPVVLYSREEIAASGVASLGDFQQLMPWQGGGQTRNFSFGGDGTTQVSLRNLGARYTLVLVDGKRWVYGGLGAGSNFVPAFDLNALSTTVVERIEVLKDGASAVYGSDAIAGVVNIITRKRMNGVELEGYSGLSTHGDAFQATVNGTAGASNDRGGFLLSFGYLHQEPVLAGDRSWSSRSYSYNFANGTVAPAGSTTVPAGTAVVDASKCSTQLCQRLNGAYPGAGRTTWIADGNTGLGVPVVTDPLTGQQWRRFVASGSVNDLYNANPPQSLLDPSDRVSMFANGDYRLSDYARVKLQGAWVRSESGYQASSQVFSTGGIGASLDPTNPYNPFGVPISLASKRMDALGLRARDYDNQTIQINTGVDGTVASTYWSLAVGWGRTTSSQTQLGSDDTSKVASAIGPAHQDQNGVWQCGAAGTSIAGCTPLNLFGVGSVTPDMAKALGPFTGLAQGFSELTVFDA